MDDELAKLDFLLGLDSGQNRPNGVCDKGIFFSLFFFLEFSGFFVWIFYI